MYPVRGNSFFSGFPHDVSCHGKSGAAHRSSLFHGSLACPLDWGLTPLTTSSSSRNTETWIGKNTKSFSQFPFVLHLTSAGLSPALVPHSLRLWYNLFLFSSASFPSCLAVDYGTLVKSSSYTKGCSSGLSYSFVMVMQGGTGEPYVVPALQNTDRLSLQMNNELSK